MDRAWLRRILNAADHPSPEKCLARLFPASGPTTEFLDDGNVPRPVIFDRARAHVREATEYVWVLNSHVTEPGLSTLEAQLKVGNLENRVAAAEKVMAQHSYYDELIGQAERDRDFEYIRLVQVPGGTITPENTGYHYLRHFYRMLEASEPFPSGNFAASRPIQVLLLQGTPVRNTTFVVIDGHTVVMQITGLTPDGSYEMRGAQIIQDHRRDGDPQRYARLFEHLRRGYEGRVASVRRADLEQFDEARCLLGEKIAPTLIELIRDLLTDETKHWTWREPTTAKLLARMLDEGDVRGSVKGIINELMRDNSLEHHLMRIFGNEASYPDLVEWWEREKGA